MRLESLFAKLRKRLSGQYSGEFRSILKGSGMTVADSRQYVPGDPQKFVNRKQSAKHNDLYVSLFDQEHDAQVDFFCDINYNWSSAEVSDAVGELLADLVLFAGKQGLQLHHRWYADALQHVRMQKQSDWYVQWHALLQAITSQSPVYRSHVSVFLQHCRGVKKRRMIVIVSDFLDMSDRDVVTLRALDKDHQLVLFRVPVSQWEGVNYIGHTRKIYGSIERLFVDVELGRTM